MDVIGWIICIVVAVISTVSTTLVAYATASITGKIGKEWASLAIVAAIFWYLSVFHAPFSVSANYN